MAFSARDNDQDRWSGDCSTTRGNGGWWAPSPSSPLFSSSSLLSPSSSSYILCITKNNDCLVGGSTAVVLQISTGSIFRVEPQGTLSSSSSSLNYHCAGIQEDPLVLQHHQNHRHNHRRLQHDHYHQVRGDSVVLLRKRQSEFPLQQNDDQPQLKSFYSSKLFVEKAQSTNTNWRAERSSTKF